MPKPICMICYQELTEKRLAELKIGEPFSCKEHEKEAWEKHKSQIDSFFEDKERTRKQQPHA